MVKLCAAQELRRLCPSIRTSVATLVLYPVLFARV